jgi:hypothetical protein
MMRSRIFGMGMIGLMLILGTGLAACGQGNSSGDTGLVPLDALLANPQKYAGQYLCTEGVQVDGFEASGLAASVYEKDGYRQLADPVIWLEGADLQSREDCTRTDTAHSFEFCQAVVCGVFETGSGYGHGGAYASQIRGRDVSVLPDPTVTSAPVPTTPLTDSPPVAPTPGGESAHQGPPPAILEVDGREQVSGIGNYCWPHGPGGSPRPSSVQMPLPS